MRLLRLLFLSLALTAFCQTGSAFAQSQPPQLRAGSHAGYGRLVFEWPQQTEYQITETSGRVLIEFGVNVAIPSLTGRAAPRNVQSVAGRAGTAVITLAPGATFRHYRLGNRIVIDVADPASAATPPSANGGLVRSERERQTSSRAGRDADARGNGTPQRIAPPPVPPPAPPSGQRPATQAPSSRIQTDGQVETPVAPPVVAPEPLPAAQPAVPVAPTVNAPALQMPPRENIPPATPAPATEAPALPRRSDDAAPPTPGTAAERAPSTSTPAALRPATGDRPASPAPTTSPAAGTAAERAPTTSTPAAPRPATGDRSVPPAAERAPTALTPAPQRPATQAPAERQTSVAPRSLAQRRPAPTLAGMVVRTETDGDAAVFERNGAYWLVFPDGRLDTVEALPDGVSVENTGGTLIIRQRIERAGPPSILRTQGGWRISEAGGMPALALAPRVDASSGLLSIPVDGPGRVVVVADPQTGGNLLIGTLRNAAAGVSLPREFAQFSVLPSVRGVVVLAMSDDVSMRASPEGFVIGRAQGGEGGLALSQGAEVPAMVASATRVMDLPPGEPEGLLEQLKNDLAEASTSPPLGRGPARLRSARTLISLGMGIEAQAVMRLLATEDPRLAQTPEGRLMQSAAAVIADRADEADDLNKPGLGESDEVRLWQALRALELWQKPADVASFLQAGIPIVQSYPRNLRTRLAPVVAEALLDAGQLQPARTLIHSMPNMPELAMARAMEKEAAGDVSGAIAAYTALVQGPNRWNSARAWRKLVELRLAAHEIPPAEAANLLESRLAAWRGDAYERDLRVRIADLRSQTGDFPAAIAALREAIEVFPDDAVLLRGKLTAMMTAMAEADAADKIPPMAFVTIMEQNADALPQGETGTRLASLLADKLLALDLPARAAAVLERVMQASTDPVERSRLGLRLADIQIRERDGAAALAALAKSVPPAGTTLPAPLAEARGLASARAELARNNKDRAMAILGDLGGDAADSLRATILAQTGDWQAAGNVLSTLAARTIPATGTLDDNARRLLLRQAVAAAMAGDATTLQQLREKTGPRFADGPLSDMFRVLTAKDVSSLADLPRLAREIELARAAPGALGGLSQQP